MKPVLGTICSALALMSVAAAPPALATWAPDGNLVDHPALLDPWDPRVIPGPDGGTIVVFVAHEDGYHDIYAQRYDAWGNALWGDGRIVIVSDNEQYAPAVVGDGFGGVYVAWTDFRSGVSEGVWAQHLDPEGNQMWPSGGYSLVTGSGNSPRICSDQAGGAIVSWRDGRGTDNDIYAQRLAPGGTELWTAGGFAVCAATGDQSNFAMVSNGFGGAYFLWSIDTGTDRDILGQHVNAGGWHEWHTTPAGRVICSAPGDQMWPLAISDDHDRVIAAWMDFRATNYDVYAQLVNQAGNGVWTTNGVAVQTGFGGRYDLVLASDGAGGAILCWDEGNLVAQRVDLTGNLLWGSTGVVVCEPFTYVNTPAIVADGIGGAIVAWQDNRFGNSDIYAQRLGPNGTIGTPGPGQGVWQANGVAVCTARGDQVSPRLAGDGAGGGYLVWTDGRADEYTVDIFVQRVERKGYWGYPCPTITAVDDIPGDEGWVVNVAWDASRLDPWPEESIGSYSLWRALDNTTPENFPAGAVQMDLADFEPGLKGRIVRRDNDPTKALYWEYLGELSARNLTHYAQPLPTLFNLTPETQGYHAFQIVAHGFDSPYAGGYWISQPDTGRSIDNLAPAEPGMVVGKQVYDPVRLEITWEPNTETDLSHYVVHRGTQPEFVPSPTNLMATVTEPMAQDPAWQMGSAYYYKISALDVHGNESPFAVLSPASVSGADTEEVPAATTMVGVHPNPFNPLTTVAFSVRDPQRVAVVVYDLAGRKVATLTDNEWPVGTHSVTWQGRNEAGRAVASGAYFVGFRARDRFETTKIMLVR